MSKNLFWPWKSQFSTQNWQEFTKVGIEMHPILPKIFSCYGLIGLTVLIGIRKKGGFEELKKYGYVKPGKTGIKNPEFLVLFRNPIYLL
jgi:hypothetical protein